VAGAMAGAVMEGKKGFETEGKPRTAEAKQ
jgi:hypothetical protein